MIGKIFFTMLVIVIIGMIFRSKNQAQAPVNRPSKLNNTVPEPSLPPKIVAYILVVLLIIAASVVYYFSWSDANQILTLRVINASGQLSEYQAYQKDLNGRVFTNITGNLIQLADTDRLEIIKAK